jgi:hypothetical protein
MAVNMAGDIDFSSEFDGRINRAGTQLHVDTPPCGK